MQPFFSDLLWHSGGTSFRYVLGTPTRGTPGAFYKLCWAPASAEGALEDFKVQVTESARACSYYSS